ncbi:MAG: tRNA 2-thiouridine(34) synthase MnmA [Desulfovibrionaceae bacterium]|nr:tRNA 2-thiouridine(34) synthase MnmA [Desulfovibrionaceae bacterium]
MPVAVAVSGGLDSLCALLLLKEAGETPLALHGLFHSPHVPAHLPPLLDQLHIPLMTLDLRESFQVHVIDKTEASLLAGKTPNPCALCNRHIKFGLLLNHAHDHGLPLATGHYAAKTSCQGFPLLTSPLDSAKDQSYFLSRISPLALDSILFPLATTNKEACRRILREKQIHIPEKESQDICFSPKVTGTPGPIRILSERGSHFAAIPHMGLDRYTIGQRKGLAIAYTEPLYVVRKDVAHNTLYLGTKAFLGMLGLTADHITLFLPKALWPDKLFVRVRYRQKACPASVRLLDEKILVRFPSPVFPSDIDQVLSVTDEKGRILAGGLISDLDLLCDPFC